MRASTFLISFTMNILAIETSCDETAISIVAVSGENKEKVSFDILSDVVLSQAQLHAEYGGVFPSLAKREHGLNLVPVLKKALEQGFEISNFQFSTPKHFSNETIFKLKTVLGKNPELLEQFLEEIPNIAKPNIDAIAITNGPGLEPALWVGVSFAKALSIAWDIPLIPVNHMSGHIFSAFMDEKKFTITNFKNKSASEEYFPVVSLLVSGGHTELVVIKDWLEYKKIGKTRDDAVGEAFDKVARILGLPYPGGPEISKLASQFEALGGKASKLELPSPMINSDDYDFSFSGLKTAVLYMVKKLGELSQTQKVEIAHAFQEAAIEVLVKKTVLASEQYGAKIATLGGGVAANSALRDKLASKLKEQLSDTTFKIPNLKYTGDNASMIAVAGYFTYAKNGFVKDPLEIKADGGLSL